MRCDARFCDLGHGSWENAFAKASLATRMFFISFIGRRAHCIIDGRGLNKPCGIRSQCLLSGKVSLDRLISSIALSDCPRLLYSSSSPFANTKEGFAFTRGPEREPSNACLSRPNTNIEIVTVDNPGGADYYLSGTFFYETKSLEMSTKLSKVTEPHVTHLQMLLCRNLLLTVRDCRQLLYGCKHLCKRKNKYVLMKVIPIQWHFYSFFLLKTYSITPNSGHHLETFAIRPGPIANIKDNLIFVLLEGLLSK